MVSLTTYTMEQNPQFGPSDLPFNFKRRKVSVFRTYPENFKRPKYESVTNLSANNSSSVCDQEDEPSESSEYDDLQSQEQLITAQTHTFSNDSECIKVVQESDETQITFPRKKVPVIRDFPKTFNEICREVNSVQKDEMNLEGDFESFEDGLYSSEGKFVDKETEDSSEEIESSMTHSLEKLITTQIRTFSNDLDCEKFLPESDEKLIVQSDTQITFPRKKVPVIREFPKVFEEIYGKVISVQNEDMNLEGGFESFEDDLNSLDEKFVDKETEDLSEELESSIADSLESLITTQSHAFSNDLEYEEFVSESDEKIRGQSETQITFPRKEVPVIREFPKVFEEICGKVISVQNEDMNLDGGFESFEDELNSLEEKFVDTETEDLTEELDYSIADSIENLITTEIRTSSNDLEYEEFVPESDEKITGQFETQITFPINSVQNEDMYLEGGFESFDDGLISSSEEKFVDKETEDLSDELESSITYSLDNKDSRNEFFGDKRRKYISKRGVPVKRFFPPRCGTNAHIGDEDFGEN